MIIHVSETEPRRRKKIFEQNNEEANTSRRQNVVSVDPGSHLAQDMRRCSQSIIFPSQKPVIVSSSRKTEDVFR